jgi:hypothetical protein
MPLITDDITHTDGADNTPGLYQKAFLIPRSFVETMPDPVQTDPAAAGNFDYEDLVTIIDNIVMKENKAPIAVYSTLEEGELKSMMQGSIDGKTFAPEITVFFPGNKKEIMGFVSWAKNNHFYVIAQDADEKKMLIGHKVCPAVLDKFEFTSGKKGDDRKGATITFSVKKSKRPVYYFEGEVDLTGDGFGDGPNNFATMEYVP